MKDIIFKALMLKGEKGDIGYPTDEQVSASLSEMGSTLVNPWMATNADEIIGDWLADHPEATTSIPDDSILESKINSNFLKSIKNCYVTPQMFGAIGDGAADDLNAFNNALNSLNAGGVLYVPDGLYYLSDQFVIDKSHITMIMSNDAYVFTTAPTTLGQTIGVFNVENGVTGDGTVVNYESWEWIEDVHIIGGHVYNTASTGKDNGIGIGRGVKDCSIENVIIDSCTNKGITAQYGIKNLMISNCTVRNCTYAGISIETAVESVPSVKIDNCHAESCANGIFVTVTDGTAISNCTVDNCKDGIYISKSVGVNIANCSLTNNREFGILNSNHSDSTISNIFINKATTAGVQNWNSILRLCNSYINNAPTGINSPQTATDHGKPITIENVKLENISGRGISLLYASMFVIKSCHIASQSHAIYLQYLQNAGIIANNILETDFVGVTNDHPAGNITYIGNYFKCQYGTNQSSANGYVGISTANIFDCNTDHYSWKPVTSNDLSI